jgi:hypothetical protein
MLWTEPGRALEPGADVTVSRTLPLPAIIELEVTVADRRGRERGESPTFEWTLREDTRGRLHVRLDGALESAVLMLDEKPVGPTTSVPATATGRMIRLTALVAREQVLVWVDKWFLGDYRGPPAEATLRLRATGEPGAVTLVEMRGYEVR